jgi:hypothetical protein
MFLNFLCRLGGITMELRMTMMTINLDMYTHNKDNDHTMPITALLRPLALFTHNGLRHGGSLGLCVLGLFFHHFLLHTL